MKSQPPERSVASQISLLQRPLGGRRMLSWTLFLSILFSFLAVPLAASMWPTEFSAQMVKIGIDLEKAPPNNTPVSINIKASTIKPPLITTKSSYMHLDLPWSPGQLASGHKQWNNDCKVCHTEPFGRVKDSDCKVCHDQMGDHVSPGVVKIEALHEVRCATCHRDHQGEFGLAEQNLHYSGQNCADCHADIKKSFPKTKTMNVTDFSTDHPEFRLQMNSEADPVVLTRVRQDAKRLLTQETNLKFPHSLHLSKKGIRSANGETVKMECKDCHTPNPDGTTFKPITMKDNCQSCHALKFEPAASNREVPHGSVTEVLNTLREFYSYIGANRVQIDKRPEFGAINLLRPGKSEPTARFVASPVDARTMAVRAATELFEKTSCYECHQVTKVPGPGMPGTPGADMPQYKIAPIAKLHQWLPKAQFSHARHTSAQCSECHDAAQSKEATDVMIPTIAICRDCHSGKEPENNKVVSDCGLCHGYHQASQGLVSLLKKPHMTRIGTKQ